MVLIVNSRRSVKLISAFDVYSMMLKKNTGMNKSKLVVFLLVCCMIVIISSCKKKEPKVQPSNTSAITLVIKAKYGTQSFALNSPNIDTAGRYLTMSALQFYLSHINL